MRLPLLIAVLWALPVRAQEATWAEAWAEVDRLPELPAAAPERAELLATLEERAARAREATPGTPEHTRGLLLAARLESLSPGEGAGSARERLTRAPLAGLEGDELWRLAAALPACPLRVTSVLQALRTTEPTREQQLLAFEIGVEEAQALRLAGGARPIQELLHERYPAIWSTIDLSLTLSRLGEETALDALMKTAIPRERAAGWPVADLWSSWGTATVGFGDIARGRGYLGRAVAGGSSNAALVLSRMDLLDGRLEAARSGFRPSILSSPPHAWALRGWGTSLLPAAYDPPVTAPASRQP